MKTSDDLFQLIHSLNHGERWQFKVYTSKHANRGEKNYVKLFEAIEKQQAYDEEALLKKFRKERFVKQFSVAKNYLFNLILESLEIYYADNTPEAKVERIRRRVEILYTKRLIKPAQRLLRKAKKLAEIHELSLESLKLLAWERQFMTALSGPKQMEEEMKELAVEENRLMKDHQSFSDFWRLEKTLTIRMNRYGDPRNVLERQRYKPIFDHPLLSRPDKARTVYALSCYYVIKASEAVLRNKRNIAYDYYKKAIVLVEEHAGKVARTKREYNDLYVGHLYNFLIVALDLRRFDSYFEEKLALMKAFSFEQSATGDAGGEEATTDIWGHYYSISLRRYIAQAGFEEGAKLAEEIEEYINKEIVEQPTWRQLELFLALAMFYFCSGKYGDALRCYSQMLNHPAMGDHWQLLSWVKIMCLLAHFELDNEHMMERNIRSTYRHLLKNPKRFRLERVMLHFIQKDLQRVHDTRSLKRALVRLRENIKGLIFEAQDYDYEQIYYWLESRIEGRPLPEILKEKSAR